MEPETVDTATKQPVYKTCCLPGCLEPHYARGVCSRHYAALRYAKELPSGELLPGNIKYQLTNEQITEARRRYDNGERPSILAIEYKVPYYTMLPILKRQARRNV